MHQRLAAIAPQALSPHQQAELWQWVKEAQALLTPLVGDVTLALHNHLAQGHTLVFEGAQGSLLDVDFGTYPYVTSSNATTGGFCTGSGLGPTQLTASLGIFKAYLTQARVRLRPSPLACWFVALCRGLPLA